MKILLDDITGYKFTHTKLEEYKASAHPLAMLNTKDCCSAFKFDDSKPLLNKYHVMALLYILFGVRAGEYNMSRYEWIDTKSPARA